LVGHHPKAELLARYTFGQLLGALDSICRINPNLKRLSNEPIKTQDRIYDSGDRESFAWNEAKQ